MKASKRRARAKKSTQKSQSNPTVQAAFSDAEEAFFQEGAALSTAIHERESFADLDTGIVRKPGFLRRLFSRDERRSWSTSDQTCAG